MIRISAVLPPGATLVSTLRPPVGLGLHLYAMCWTSEIFLPPAHVLLVSACRRGEHSLILTTPTVPGVSLASLRYGEWLSLNWGLTTHSDPIEVTLRNYSEEREHAVALGFEGAGPRLYPR